MASRNDVVGGLDAHAVVDHGGDAGRLERLEDHLHRRQARHDRVGDDQRPPNAEVYQVLAHFARHAGAEAHV